MYIQVTFDLIWMLRACSWFFFRVDLVAVVEQYPSRYSRACTRVSHVYGGAIPIIYRMWTNIYYYYLCTILAVMDNVHGWLCSAQQQQHHQHQLASSSILPVHVYPWGSYNFQFFSVLRLCLLASKRQISVQYSVHATAAEATQHERAAIEKGNTHWPRAIIIIHEQWTKIRLNRCMCARHGTERLLPVRDYKYNTMRSTRDRNEAFCDRRERKWHIYWERAQEWIFSILFVLWSSSVFRLAVNVPYWQSEEWVNINLFGAVEQCVTGFDTFPFYIVYYFQLKQNVRGIRVNLERGIMIVNDWRLYSPRYHITHTLTHIGPYWPE